MIRKWPVEHGQELHPEPNFLVIGEAYLSATFGPNISDFFDSCFHWVSIVRESMHSIVKKTHGDLILFYF